MNSLRDRLRDYILENDSVTFAELANRFGDEVHDKNEIALAICKRDNIILWQGLTQEAFDAIVELERDKIIEMRPSTFLAYLMDGQVLKMPLVKQNRDYKTPHWLPTVLGRPLVAIECERTRT